MLKKGLGVVRRLTNWQPIVVFALLLGASGVWWLIEKPLLQHGPALAAQKTVEKLGEVSFSQDGSLLLITRCGGVLSTCAIHEYAIATGKLRYYKSPGNEVWGGGARYSPQGDWIVFTITPVINGRQVMEDTQLAIMRPDGSERRVLTNSQGWKVAPSFSPSGKKIIYVRAGKLREAGKTPAADYDLWSYDLESGTEEQLTHFKFFLISQPFYLDNDDRFIFSAEFPGQYPDLPPGDRAARDAREAELKEKYRDDRIYVMDRSTSSFLKPWIRFNDYSDRPLVSSKSQQIFFEGKALPKEGMLGGMDFHEFISSGVHRRITRLGAGSLWHADASPDGQWLVTLTSTYKDSGIRFSDTPVPRHLSLWNTRTGDSHEIVLPRDAMPIDYQSQGLSHRL